MDTLTMEQIKAEEIVQILSNMIMKQIKIDSEKLKGEKDESK